MRSVLLVTAALGLAACGHQQLTRVNLEHQPLFGVVEIDPRFSYLIDSRTESCFLKQEAANSNFALVPVPCDKLKKNVPEAAAYITWFPDSAPAPANAPPPAP